MECVGEISYGLLRDCVCVGFVGDCCVVVCGLF